jgi:hypothetical protein
MNAAATQLDTYVNHAVLQATFGMHEDSISVA